jgi:hypothetical protein
MQLKAASISPEPTAFVRSKVAASIIGVSDPLFRALVKRGDGPPSITISKSQLFCVA